MATSTSSSCLLNERPLLYRNDTPEDFSWLTIGPYDPANPGNR
ncbi:MAG: hypothetical protein R2789_19105 [Microthrixaceae bacterium]